MNLGHPISRNAALLLKFPPIRQHLCFQSLPHSFALFSWKSFVYCVFPKSMGGIPPNSSSIEPAIPGTRTKSHTAIDIAARSLLIACHRSTKAVIPNPVACLWRALVRDLLLPFPFPVIPSERSDEGPLCRFLLCRAASSVPSTRALRCERIHSPTEFPASDCVIASARLGGR
jgi:hypothetical protein